MNDVTRILSAIEQGDPQAAEQLLPLVYDELRKLAAQRLAQEKPGQTLQATALVHEAYLRLVGRRGGPAMGRPRPLLRRRRRGHAPHPRRERPPQAAPEARRRPAAASTSTRSSSPSRPPPTTCSPSTRPSTRLGRRGPGQGRAGQAPLLRRPDRSTRPPSVLGISPRDRRPPLGVTPGPGSLGELARRPTAPRTIPEISPDPWSQPAAVLALPYGGDVRRPGARPMNRGSSERRGASSSPPWSSTTRRPARRLPRPGLRRRRELRRRGRAAARPLDARGERLPRGPGLDADGRPSPRSRRAPRGPARSSAPTSCWSRSARGAWASSTWPSRRSPSAARWP